MREAPEERLIVIARRAPNSSKALPVRHGGLPDGLVLQEVFSDAETVVARTCFSPFDLVTPCCSTR